MSKEIRRINLLGGPGVGKTTLAAGIFQSLKMRSVSIELVTEYVKSWAYDNKPIESCDQIYIFAKQQRFEDRVLRKSVKHIVSDSPLFLQTVYAKMQKHMGWKNLIGLAHEFEKKYLSLNIFIERGDIKYQTEGRYQTEKEANKVDKYIKKFLNEQDIKYVCISNEMNNVEQYVLDIFSENGLLDGCVGNGLSRKQKKAIELI